MGPVFVFGTGRCGSTHLQRLISLNCDHWIWGEHDGFLAPLFRTLKSYEDSARLRRNIFDMPVPAADDALVASVRGATSDLSWLNRLDQGSLRRELRMTVVRLFSAGLPAGWTGWGFKEIRYGIADDVPAILMDMFPSARCVFCFRDPAETMRSMVLCWAPEVAADAARAAEIAGIYNGCAARWCDQMGYFVALRQARPRRLALLDLPMLGLPARRLLATLNLPLRHDQPVEPPPTNRGAVVPSAAAEQQLAESWARWGERLSEHYAAALRLRAAVAA